MAAGYLFVMGRCFYYTNAKHLVCFLGVSNLSRKEALRQDWLEMTLSQNDK